MLAGPRPNTTTSWPLPSPGIAPATNRRLAQRLPGRKEVSIGKLAVGDVTAHSSECCNLFSESLGKPVRRVKPGWPGGVAGSARPLDRLVTSQENTVEFGHIDSQNKPVHLCLREVLSDSTV